MKKPEQVPVEFVKNQPPYLTGEKTLRIPKDAMQLVDAGVAKYLDPPPGLDEFGNALEEKKAAPKPKTTTPKPKGKAKAKDKPKGKS